MSRLVSSTYMVVQADDANALAREVDNAMKAGFKLQGGIAMCMRPRVFGDGLMPWFAQALVQEFWVSDNGE